MNCDGQVTGLDLGVVINAANWSKIMDSADPPLDPRADVDRNGVVNGLDNAPIVNRACWLVQ